MKSFYKYCIIGLLLGNGINAQNRPLLGIDEALQLAIQNNGGIKAGSLATKATQSLEKTARELPKTTIAMQLGQYNSIRFDNALQFSQTLPFPSLFKAKKGLIAAQVTGQERQQEVSVNSLKSQIRTYYYQIQYLQNNKIKLQYLDSLYADFIRVATLRYKTGETKKIEINIAATKKGEINVLLQQNETYLVNAHRSLAALLNTQENFDVIQDIEYKPLEISTLIDSNSVVNHPIVQALYQNARIAEQSRKVEKAQGQPDFILGYTNQSLIGFQTVNGQDQYFGGGRRFNVATVGIAIPLTYGATKARMKALDYQQEAIQVVAQQQRRELETQLQNAFLQYQRDLEQYRYYQNQAIPNAREIVKTVQIGYHTGDIDYVEYLYALQTATDVELKNLYAIEQINNSVIGIYYLLNR